MSYSNIFVCLMGLGTVFFSLICLIFLTYLMHLLSPERKLAAAPDSAAVSVKRESHRPEMIAALAAALANDMGTDVSRIRILCINKV